MTENRKIASLTPRSSGLNYSYGTTTNNGNIQSYSYSGGGLSYTQSFSYDSLNRLSTATETNGGSTNWSQTNAYDRYGNRQIDYGGGSYNLAFSSSSNRITTSGYSYDSSGNLTDDGSHSYGFDAESKVKSVDSTTAYTYDGEAKRVRKLVGENTRFIYGIGGQLVAEYDGSSGNLKKEYISGGITVEPTAVNSNGTQYGTGDHLGSPRVITNSSGSVVSRHDYMPFGEELGASVGGRTTGMGFSGSGDNNRKKFTGYERDTETGLDFAQARFYGSTQGRFTSPDPFSASAIIADPQTFNRYAYCRNNPVNSTDPTGMVAGAMAMPSGERANVVNSLIDTVHGDIAEMERAWEQQVHDAFLGVHQNESVTVFISADPAADGKGDNASSDEGKAGEDSAAEPQNSTVLGLVNQTFANTVCQDFMGTVLNNASTKANPVLEGGDIKKIFSDFLAQRNGGISRERKTSYGTATGRIGTNGKGNGTLFLPLYKNPQPSQDWLDASGIVNELPHIAGSKGGWPNYNQYDDYALAQAVHTSKYDASSSFTGNKNPFAAGATDRADPRWSNYFHDILRKNCIVPH